MDKIDLSIPRTIDVLLFDGVNLLDVAGPVQAFNEAFIKGSKAYRVRFVVLPDTTTSADQSLVVRSSCGLPLVADALATEESDACDLLIPGGDGVNAQIGNATLRNLISRWYNKRPGSRIISACSGALLLADSGILNSKVATTHWSREAEVLARFPKVRWQTDELMVLDGQVFTSAGVTTSIDLALKIIRIDCGATTALSVARELVVYLTRSSGQNQYAQIIEWQFTGNDQVDRLINKLIERPAHDWSLETMASEIDMTPRTLTRRFKTSFNSSPIKFLEQLRVRLAGDLLCEGMPLARVATRIGFTDTQTLRRAFKRQLATTPGEYVRRFTLS